MSQKIDAFRFLVPVADQFRSLAPQLAARYVELSGGSAGDAEAFSQAVTAALERISSGLEPGAHVHLAFSPEAGGLHVDLSCEGRRESVDVTIPVANR
jgi:hypothetical protein